MHAIGQEQSILNTLSAEVYRSGADPKRHAGRAPPHFYKWLVMGDTVSRRTANKKLAKLY